MEVPHVEYQDKNMTTEQINMQPNVMRSLAAARKSVVKVALIYIVLVALWILLQSGIPMLLFIDYKVEPFTWIQIWSGAFFFGSTGWLLYLLVARGMRLAAAALDALRLRDRAIESSINAIFITDSRQADNPIVSVNPAFERITGYAAAEAIGRNPRFLQAADVNQPELEAVRVAFREGRDCHVVLRNYRKDGSMYWSELFIGPVENEGGVVSHYVWVQNDITETKRYQDELARQANYDTLTGLPNRNLLSDRAARAMVRARRYNRDIAVVFIDLDNFRVINDSLGYAVGNNMLRLVGERLGSSMRIVDTVGRVGGDEFVLVLEDQEKERLFTSQMQRILNVFSKPFLLGDRELFVTASIGVASYPHDGEKVETLLQNAEIAMYRAKDLGRNGFQFYKTEMNAQVNERLSLESWLRRAVDRKELSLHYQPQLDLRTNRVIGAEALIRWQHPKLGMIPPGKFIPLAEQTGIIVPIGEWVLRTACAQNKAWQDAGLPPITIAVNISARQFREKGLVKTIADILGETRLDPRYLELEVTEGVIMHDAEEVIRILQQLKSMGVKLSIDDFGTGYSSLSYLKRFPVDRLKIDQSFVRDVTSNSDDAAIALAVINLGHSLDLRVIAEGVETEEQLKFLRGHHCDEKQGYLFSKPIPAEDFTKLLKEGRTLAV